MRPSANAVEQLLATLRADPASAARAVSKATGGTQKQKTEILLALKTDARFGPPLREAIRDPKVLRDAAWLVTFLGALRFAPAVPELLTVWRMRDARVSYQAGQALLRIGEIKALEEMADDLRVTRGTETSVALDAVFQLGPERAYDRLASHLDADGVTASILYRVAAETKPFATEPRWKPLALKVLRSGEKGAVDAARELLTKGLSKAELRELLAVDAPRPAAPKRESRPARERALRDARVILTKITGTLPRRGWIPATAKNARQLAQLESLVGPLPACVRAFYESASGIDIGAKIPRDRFVVCSLAEVLREARAWAKKYGRQKTPAELAIPFLFPIAPDGYTKAGLSGGPPIGFEMPAAGDDPILANARGKPRFTQFLKRATRTRTT